MHVKLLFSGVGGFVCGVLLGTFIYFSIFEVGSFVAVTAAILILSICAKRGKVRSVLIVIAVLLCGGTTGIVRASLAPRELPQSFVPLLNHSIALSGKIVADPDRREKNQQLVVATSRNGIETNVLVFAPLVQRYSYGEHIHASGMLTAPEPFDTNGGRQFRYDQYLSKKGIFSTLQKAKVSLVSEPTSLLDELTEGIYSLKHSFVRGLEHALPSPYDQLAVGLLTGDQHGLPEEVANALELSGLVWVVVLSGYHVMLIAEGVLFALVTFPKRWRFVCAAGAVVLVVFATGMSAPSMRGALMALGSLYAQATDRAYDSLRVLGVSLVLILLYNPFLLAFDAGLQLSILITPALILGTPILEKWFLWIREPIIRESVVVSILAQLACWPLLLWQTGQLGLWAVPANILVTPFIPAAIFTACAAGFAGVFLPSVAHVIALPAYALLWYLLPIAKAAAALPLSSAIIPAFSFWFVPAMYLALVLLLRRLR